MRVLVTGAGGHIGAAVIAELVGDRHQVVGLTRSSASAARAAAAGARVLRGDVGDAELLTDAVSDADAVIHLAYDHAAVAAGDLHTASQKDLAVTEVIADALAGTRKLFVGVGLAPTGDTAVDQVLATNPRALVAQRVLSLSHRGLRPRLIAVPPVVHSDADRAGFLPTLIAIARQSGVSAYVGDGRNRWPAVHTSDLATLFRLALGDAAGSQLVGSAELGVPVGDIAAVIGRHLDVTVRSLPADEAAAHFAPFGFAGMDLTLDSSATRRQLGWNIIGPSLLTDLDHGHYFDAQAALRATGRSDSPSDHAEDRKEPPHGVEPPPTR